MANKILPIQKQETIYYGDYEVKNFWKTPQNARFTGHRDKINEILDSISEGIVCVCSEILTDKKLIERIFNTSEKVKFYILVSNYSKEMELLEGKALIRYSGVNNIGSFILVNPNSNVPKGVFFSGQLSEQSLLIEHFSCDINADKIKEVFRHFCYQFWENAKFEIVEKGVHSPIVSKPMDVYYDKDRYGGKIFVYSTLFDYEEKAKREDLSAQKIVYLNQENLLPIEIIAESSKDMGENIIKELLPQEDFEVQKPDFKDDAVSIKINFLWENIPYYLPDGAKKHNLYSQWETELKKIQNKLDELADEIIEMEQQEKNVSQRLARFFLGKKTLFNKLKEQINNMKNIDFPNLTEEERNEPIEQINNISKEIASHKKEITNESRKAKIDDEIEVLKTQREDKESELKTLKTPSDVRFKGKYEDDKNKLEKEIKILGDQIRNKEQEKLRIDNLNNTNMESSLTAFSKTDKKLSHTDSVRNFEIQNLQQLPQIGILYSAGGNHFLAIEYWEEYPLGKEEAKRLKSKLCATK